MRIALKFAYDGRNFYGYARQPQLKTVEGELLKLLTKQDFIEDTKTSCFRSASRTDKGVSSLGSVIAFNTEKSIDNIFKEINTNSKEILFYGVKEVGPDFYPRYAKQRIYRYYLKNNDFDMEKIISAASLFTGTHNFSNFARVEDSKNPEKTIDNIVVGENKQFFTIDFYAQTFLWHQIRRIMSTIEKAATGKINEEQIIDALNKPELGVDYGVAPPKPLILKNIIYQFNFEHNDLYLKLKMLEDKIIKNV
ncbi:MAG: tRNA pseudouridine(38-40) synthase TruA [Candidatus Thermoplasmatota archaeon]|nr:tRNA pseudouridine(38-40) synthase TruA [Candidatus Thermoplasmatota archaeon]